MQIAFAKALMNLFCTGGVFTACINNYKIHTVKPRRRKKLPIFCTLITFILLAKYVFRDKHESASHYKNRLVNYRWRRQFLYLKLLVLVCFIPLSAMLIQHRGFTEVSFRFEIKLWKPAGTKSIHKSYCIVSTHLIVGCCKVGLVSVVFLYKLDAV